jgi:hypothetical protein
MQTGVKKDGGVEHERAPHSKRSSRSHHVEVVLARIFAKQLGYMKQKSLRHLDLEDGSTGWH